MTTKRGLNVLLEVDGGVTLSDAKSIVDAGPDVMVAGNTGSEAADPTPTTA